MFVVPANGAGTEVGIANFGDSMIASSVGAEAGVSRAVAVVAASRS
jgi:hypothetical protein